MRKLLLAILIVAMSPLSDRMDANACGDKLLKVGRSIRFQRKIASRRPATMLIYTPANSATLPAASKAQIQEYFQKVGHKPLAVENIDKFNEALKSGHYDLVLTDVADAATLRQQIERLSSQVAVLPILYKRKKGEEAAAARQYPFMVKNPKSAGDFLLAIDKVMKSRESSIPRKA